MMKFFRKHNKKLMAIMMSLLMIVFVGGSALQSLMSPERNVVEATSRLGAIKTADLQAARFTTSILASLGFNWRRPVAGAVVDLQVLDWVLLCREADEIGATVTTSTVRSRLDSNLVGVALPNFAKLRKVKLNSVFDAFGELIKIQDMADGLRAAVIPGEAEVRVAARNALDKVKINAVMFPADKFAQEDESFTDAEIDAQFNEFRKAKPELGRRLSFGYFIPPKVRLQYIKIDRDALIEAAHVPNLEKRAKTYFDQNRKTDASFRRPPEDENDDEDPQDEDVPCEDEDPDAIYMTWEEASDVAAHFVRRQFADETAKRIANWLIPALSEPWYEVKKEKSGYKPAPESARELTHYAETLARMDKTISYPTALTIKESDFFTQDEAFDVPDIGLARTSAGGFSGLMINTLAFLNDGVVPTVPTERGINPTDYLSIFQTSQYQLVDAAGSVYLFRIVGFKQEHAPASLEDVRDAVVADLRLLSAYERAMSLADALAERADTKGLKEAFDQDAALGVLKGSTSDRYAGYVEPAAFSRVQPGLAHFGRKGQDDVFIAAKIGQVPNAAADQCFALEHADRKSDLVELRDRAIVMVVEWQESLPGREDQFSQMRKQLTDDLTRVRFRMAVGDWLNPENIRDRTGFNQ